jgi:hypothetical protein
MTACFDYIYSGLQRSPENNTQGMREAIDSHFGLAFGCHRTQLHHHWRYSS